MGTQPGQVRGEKFSNWVKDTLALLYTKECLEVIADERSTVFHGQLKTAVGNNSTCTCSWQALNQDRKHQKWVVKNCQGVCQKWLDLIISHHNNRPLPKLAPRNTDPGRWPSDTWEVMKVYQSNGCQRHHSARDADVAALIDLMRNCNHFGPLITNPSLINQVITVRNNLMHSKDLKVENQELSHDLQSMLSFLRSLTAITGTSSLSATEHQAVLTAITGVDKLRTGILDMTLNRELQLKALKAKQVALETDMVDLEQTIIDARTETAAVKSGLTDVEDKLSTEVQTIQQRLVSQLSMIQDVKKDMNMQQQSAATVVGNLAHLQQLFDVLRLDHDDAKKNITALKQQISDQEATSQNQQQESQAHAIQLEKHQRELDTHTTKLSQLELRQGEHDTHKPILQDHATQLQGHQSHIESQHRTLECHGAKLDRIENKRIAQQTDQAVDITSIQGKLIRMYEARRQHIPVYLLRSERKLRLEDIYVEQSLKVVDPDGRLRTDCTLDSRHQARAEEGRSEARTSENFVSSLRDVFYSEGNKCRYIYVSGNAGYGKSVFCSHLVRLWCKAHSEQSTKLNPDEELMAEFPLLFCVDLRDATYKGTDKMPDEICSLIQQQLQLSQLGLTGNDLSKLLQADGQVLVVMDALDECKEERLPSGGLYNNCTTLLTSRPWKLEALRCDPEYRVDKELEIVGLEEGSPEVLSEKLIELLNRKWNKGKNSRDFLQKMKKEGLQEFLDVPVLLMSMLCLWFDDVPFGKSRCEIYKSSIHHQILAAIKAKGLPEYSSPTETPFPVCQGMKCPCKCYGELLWKVSELACHFLLGNVRERSLVMDHDQIEILGMSDKEVAICMKLGILTQYKLLGTVTNYEPQKSVSFTHKTYQEWFAAIYLSSKLPECEFDKVLSKAITDLDSALALDQMFLFVCGLNAEVAAKLSKLIMSWTTSDARVQEYCRYHYTSHSQLIESTWAEFEMADMLPSSDSSIQRYSWSDNTSHNQFVKKQTLSGAVQKPCKAHFTSRVPLTDRPMLKVPSAAKVLSYRRSHYTSHDQLIRTIQDVIVAGAVEAKKNNKRSTALQLHYVSIAWHIYMGFSTEQILACDTSHAKSVFIEDVQIVKLDGKKRKITPWPASSCLEKLHLRNITNALDDTFCDNFSATQLVHLYLDNVTVTHPQLESLCGNLASAGSLKIVAIYELSCRTYYHNRQDCSILFDFSQHQGLEDVILRDLAVGEVRRISLCQNMDKLRRVELCNAALTHDGLESLCACFATAGSLRTVVIRELTCTAHKDNIDNCYINLDISQCDKLQKLWQSGCQRPNIKITSLPSSSCMQTLDFRNVYILPCDTFCDNFNLGNVSKMYLVDMAVTHDQLESLCASLTSAGSLRTVIIRELSCRTHKYSRQECSIALDLSKHQGLESLSLGDLIEVRGVSLCQNMGKLRQFELVNIALIHGGLESLCGSLASVRSLRRVDIRQLTCITHTDNRQNCTIVLDLSRHQELEYITLWDLGVSEVQGVSLCQNMTKLEKVELHNITLTHAGMESLRGSLASAWSLQTLDIRRLTCITHKGNRQDCSIMLDLSQHQGLGELTLQGVGLGGIRGVNLCQNMDKLEKVVLYKVALTHDGMDSLLSGLVSAGRIWTVKLSEVTCITHNANRQDCYIELAFPQYLILKKNIQSLRQYPKVKITLWPPSPCMQAVELIRVNILQCDTFCDNVKVDSVTQLYLHDVTLKHNQLDSLCTSLASAGSLKTAFIRKLICFTHNDNRQDCSFMLDLSQHQGLKDLTLWKLDVGEVRGVSFCQNMDSLEFVRLRGFCISASALKQALEALPEHRMSVVFGGQGVSPLRVRGTEEARQLLEEIRQETRTRVTRDDVEYTDDECIVKEFYINMVR